MSSNMSVGQILGGVAGAVIGAFVPGGYIALGASIGMAVGGAIDPPKGPHVEGPRLDDKRVQTSAYGQIIPELFGTDALHGNVFWVENNELKETATEESAGGKGGGGPTTTTYTYSATFAVALCRGPVEGIKKIWIGAKLVYDAGAVDLAGQVGSGLAANSFAFYPGTDTQQPDPRMQAALGAANTPAYRGVAYIVLYDLQLADYGNSLLGAQVKVEVVSKATLSDRAFLESHTMISSSFFSLFDDPLKIVVGEYPSTNTLIQHEYYRGEYQGAAASYIGGVHALAPVRQTDDELISGYYGSPTGLFVGAELFTDAVDKPSSTDLVSIFAASKKGTDIWLSTSISSKGAVLRTSAGNLTGKIIGSYIDEFFCLTGGVFSVRNENSSFDWRVRVFDETTLDETDTRLFEIGVSAPEYAESGRGVCAAMVGRSIFILVSGGPPRLLELNMDTGAIADLPLDVSSLPPGQLSSWWPNSPYAMRVYESGIVAIAGYTSGAASTVALWGGRTVDSELVTLSSIVSTLCIRSQLMAADIDVTDLTDLVRGYTVGTAGTLRGAIEPLAAVWPFDAVQSGYKLKFIRRPNASVITIPESDLGATTGNDTADRLTEAREMDAQLPRRISVKYKDIGREYDVSEQYDERLNTEAMNQRAIDTSVVLSSTEAANVAQQQLYRAWVERSTFSFVLPPATDYLKLEVADVVTVETATASHEMLLTTTSHLPDGRIECTAIRNDAATYSPNAVGIEGSAPPKTIALATPTTGVILDIPQVHSSQSGASVLVAMRGYSADWNGGALQVSRDSGVSWSTLVGQSVVATIGSALTALPAAMTTAFVDASSSVSVFFQSGTPVSITREQLLNGSNTYAIGAHGRWEIIGVMTVTETADNTYTLSDILRGRFGTEWATGMHQTGDSVVFLDESKLALAGLSTADFDVTNHWRFASNDYPLPPETAAIQAATGVNLECFSPASLKGTRHPTTNDWSFEGTRRTRFNGEWRDYVNAPLNEATEAYELDIFSDSNFTTLKRTLPTPAAAYTSAQQIADFGANQVELNYRFYQLSELRGRGYPLQGTLLFKENDPYWSSVTSAIHFNGVNGSTTLVDEKGIVWTHTSAVPPAAISTANYKFGSASGWFNSAATTYWSVNDSAAFQPGSGNFTIDVHINITSFTGGRPIVSRYNGGTLDWYLGVQSSGVINFNCFNAAGTQENMDTTAAITAGQWHHIRFSRVGTKGYISIDGGAPKTATVANNIRNTAGAKIFLGRSLSAGLNGYMDEFRFTNGVGRSTTSFTPPATQFPDQ